MLSVSGSLCVEAFKQDTHSVSEGETVLNKSAEDLFKSLKREETMESIL